MKRLFKLRMKIKVLFLMAFIPLMGYSRQYSAGEVFVNGTCWESSWAAIYCSPDNQEVSTLNWTEYEFLDGEAVMLGEPCLKLWNTRDLEAAERRFVAYLRVEGEKVYLIDDESDPEWRLLYDFSMTVDESEEFWEPCDEINSRRSRELTCLESGVEETFPGIEEMRLAIKYLYDENNNADANALWLKGIGSQAGLLCLLNGMDGASSLLTRVWNGDKVYFDLAGYTSIDGVSMSDVSVTVHNRDVCVSGLRAGQTICIYSVDGSLVEHVTANNESECIGLPTPGVYVLNVEGASYKVLAR